MSLALAVLLALCLAFSAQPVRGGTSDGASGAVHQYRVESTPSAWLREEEGRSSSPSPAEPLTFFVALRQRNLDELERRFWAVSDPSSPSYLDFMTGEAIQALVSPAEEDKAVVREWLTSVPPSPPVIVDWSDSFEVRTTVEGASLLLSTTFQSFRHVESGMRVVRAWGDVSLPSAVHPRVATLFGVTDFPVLRYSDHPQTQAPAQLVENDAIIPQTIHAMYGTPYNQSTTGGSTIGLGVIEWGATQSFDPQDLDWFIGNTSTPGRPSFTPDHIIGTNGYPRTSSRAPAHQHSRGALSWPAAPWRSTHCPPPPCLSARCVVCCGVTRCAVPTTSGGEASLDVDVVAGVSPSSELWFWIEEGSVWLYTFTLHFVNASSVPDIISVSYGAYEGGQCIGGRNHSECNTLGVDSAGYVHVVNTQWMKIGLRGVSIFVSSGDSGAHTRSDPNCTEPALWADFPASSPFITSVGATQVDAESYFPSSIAPACHDSRNWTCVRGGVESAVNRTRAHFTSGGGFSNISAMPAYERAAVAAFLNSSSQLPPARMYNASGRAYPDVSAIGHNAFVINRGRQGLSGGTSQSSPTFAAVVAVLAATFKSITSKSFGFMNPLLYAMQAAQPNTFNDVVAGDNRSPRTAASHCTPPHPLTHPSRWTLTHPHPLSPPLQRDSSSRVLCVCALLPLVRCTERSCTSACLGWYAAKGWDPVTGLGTPHYRNMLAYIEKLAHSVVARRGQTQTAETKQLSAEHPTALTE